MPVSLLTFVSFLINLELIKNFGAFRSSHQTSDFGQKELFCGKCVPKVAPTQAAESVEMDRAKAASKMTQEVCTVQA